MLILVVCLRFMNFLFYFYIYIGLILSLTTILSQIFTFFNVQFYDRLFCEPYLICKLFTWLSEFYKNMLRFSFFSCLMTEEKRYVTGLCLTRRQAQVYCDSPMEGGLADQCPALRTIWPAKAQPVTPHRTTYWPGLSWVQKVCFLRNSCFSQLIWTAGLCCPL